MSSDRSAELAVKLGCANRGKSISSRLLVEGRTHERDALDTMSTASKSVSSLAPSSPFASSLAPAEADSNFPSLSWAQSVLSSNESA